MESSCPGQSSSFSHKEEGNGNFLGISVVDVSIDIEVEQYRLKPYSGFLGRTIIGLGGANVEFSGFV